MLCNCACVCLHVFCQHEYIGTYAYILLTCYIQTLSCYQNASVYSHMEILAVTMLLNGSKHLVTTLK